MDHQIQQFADFSLEAQRFALARHVAHRLHSSGNQWYRALRARFQAMERASRCRAAFSQSSISSQSRRNLSKWASALQAVTIMLGDAAIVRRVVPHRPAAVSVT